MRQTLPKLAKNAYEVLSNLPKHGVGTKITRSTWQDNSFYTVTKVKTELDGKRGKAYGVLTWRGEQQGEQPCRIRGASKKLWRPLGSSNAAAGETAWPSLAASLLEKSELEADHQPELTPIAAEEGDADAEKEQTPPPS